MACGSSRRMGAPRQGFSPDRQYVQSLAKLAQDTNSARPVLCLRAITRGRGGSRHTRPRCAPRATRPLGGVSSLDRRDGFGGTRPGGFLAIRVEEAGQPMFSIGMVWRSAEPRSPMAAVDAASSRPRRPTRPAGHARLVETTRARQLIGGPSLRSFPRASTGSDRVQATVGRATMRVTQILCGR